jgi:hypothetical protein
MSTQLDARFGLCGAWTPGVFVKALDGSIIWLTRRPANSATWMNGRVVCNMRVSDDGAPEQWSLVAFTIGDPQPALLDANGANLILGAMDNPADIWACWRPDGVQTSWGLRLPNTQLLDVRADGLVAVNDHDTSTKLELYRPGDVTPWRSWSTGPIRADAVAGRRNFRFGSVSDNTAVYEWAGVGNKMLNLLTGEEMPMAPRADVAGLPVVA